MIELHDGVRDVFIPDLVPRKFDCLCHRCGDVYAEHHVRIRIAGERFDELLCTRCAGKVLALDLERTPRMGSRCEYVPTRTLDLHGRRTRDYRA
jgi:hypothetical protein